MTARQSQVLDEYRRPVSGAKVYVYHEDGTDAVLTSDGVTPLAQPVVTDQFGTYEYDAPDGAYREDTWFGGKLRFKEILTIGPLPSGPPGKTTLAIGLATAIAAMALAVPELANANTFRTDGHSATADGGEAWYYRKAVIEAAAPGDHVSVDGVRLGLVRTQALSLEMFAGGRGPAFAAANDAAIEAIKHFDEMIGEATWEVAAATVNLWKGKYYFADVNGHDLKNTRTWKAHGGGVAVAGGILGTWLIGPTNWKFLRPESYNTTGDTLEDPYTTDSAGSMFENIQFMGNNGAFPSAGDITEGYALHPRTPIGAFNCRFIFFWDGIYNNAAAGAGGASEGQASHCYYNLCSFERNANFGARNAPAPDNNIGEFAHCNFIGNGRGGLELGDFLGSYVHGGHFRDNGNQSVRFGVSSVTSFGGSVYYVNQTATMTTTDADLRVGDPTTNPLWTRLGPGAPSSYYPDYTTWAGKYQKGGPIIADRTTAARHVAIAYYTENGQPPCMWNSSCFIAPMLSGAGDVGFGTGIIDGRMVQNSAGSAYNALTQTVVAGTIAGRTLAVWNNGPNGGFGTGTSLTFEQGFEADGTTARQIARLKTYPSAAGAGISYGILYVGLRTFGGGGAQADMWQWSDGPLRAGPVSDNVVQLGMAGERLKEIFCANNVINTSDKREKVYIQALRDKLLDVADEIELRQFKYRASVKAKGKDKARWHFGVVAQQIEKACEKHGIDGFELGLLCFDKWDDIHVPKTRMVPVYEDQVASVRKSGKNGRSHIARTVKKVKVGTREEIVMKDGKPVLVRTRKAGERYGVRYDQLIILKLAAQDRRYTLLEDRVKKLEARAA